MVRVEKERKQEMLIKYQKKMIGILQSEKVESDMRSE
jgi:hypothetical protein